MSRLIPPGAEEHFVLLPEGRVRVLVGRAGPGTPAVLVHGGGTDDAGISWFRTFASLGADRRLIAIDPADSRRAAELIPGARLVLAPGTGHWAQLEAHDLFTTEARRFLREVDSR